MTDTTAAERMRRYRQRQTPEQRAKNADRNRLARADKRATALLTPVHLGALRAQLVATLAALEATDWTIYGRRNWLTMIEDIDVLVRELKPFNPLP